MSDKNFEYKDPKFLNTLVNWINGERCKLEVRMFPDVPEFIEAHMTLNLVSQIKKLPPALFSEKCKLDFKLLNDSKIKDLILLNLCEKHNILPFWSLSFDYTFSQTNKPKIEYIGNHWDVDERKGIYNICLNPINFTKNSRWHRIDFKDAKGQKNINKVKQAINEFIKQGYIITSITADLDPYLVRGDHYCDYEKSEATLIAYNGKVRFYGDVPDDFNINSLKPKQLPEPTKLLDEILKD